MFEFIATYAPQLIVAGIKYTVPLALISFVFAVIIAALVAVLRSYVPHATGIKSIGWRILKFILWLRLAVPFNANASPTVRGLLWFAKAWY